MLWGPIAKGGWSPATDRLRTGTVRLDDIVESISPQPFALLYFLYRPFYLFHELLDE